MARLPMFGRRAPAKLDRSHIDPSPLMLGNDTVGNCTIAAQIGSARAQCALAGFQIQSSSDDAVRAYSRATGYVPGNAATDRGDDEHHALSFSARNGLLIDQQALFPLWGDIEKDDLNGIGLCMQAFGTAYLGVTLAPSDLWVDDWGRPPPVWDTQVPASYGDPNPSQTLGHALISWDYTGLAQPDDIINLITWGMKQKATVRWLRSRMDEAHGIAWPQLAPASGRLDGRDWSALREQNASYLSYGVGV